MPLRLLLSCLLLVLCNCPAQSQTTHIWNNASSGLWSASANWHLNLAPNDPILSIARFQSLGSGIANQAGLGSSSFSILGLELNGNYSWSLGQSSDSGVLNLGSRGLLLDAGSTKAVTLNYRLNLTDDQKWDTAGSTVTHLGALSGSNALTKSGLGTLVLDNASNSFSGSISVDAGTLQIGSSSNNAAQFALHGNSVDLASGTTLVTAGSSPNLNIGRLSGSGVVNLASTGILNLFAYENGAFSGSITASGGLYIRGTNTQQTFTGNTSGIGASTNILTSATLVLGGSNATSGTLGSSTINVQHGSLILDNSSFSANRIPDTAAMNLYGANLTLIGNSAGTIETMGTLTLLNSGPSTIQVIHNGGSGGTELKFANSGTLRGSSTSMTVNFVGVGGTLGSEGANPRISFAGAMYFSSDTGMISNSMTSPSFGWGTVNNTSWAGVKQLSNGSYTVYALSDTLRTELDLANTPGNERVSYTPNPLSSPLTLTNNLKTGALKIIPSAPGQSLNLNSGLYLQTNALMLAGPYSFSINGGLGSYLMESVNFRYVYVLDPSAVLSMNGNMTAALQPVIKTGAGFLELNGTTSQLVFNAGLNIFPICVSQGVLRGTPTTLGGGTSSSGIRSTYLLVGGVLEISGGGTFSRAVGVDGTVLGGGLRFDNGSTIRGDGGFSAYNGNATVTLVTAIGGTTPANLVWNDGKFLADGYAFLLGSIKADSRLDFTNSIGLDNGASTNPYSVREIRVADNPNSTTDIMRLSGVISGSKNSDLLKTDAGTLELTGANTYAGNTIVKGGTLVLSGSYTGGGNFTVNAGATLQINSNFTLNSSISGSGNVVLSGNSTLTGTGVITGRFTLQPGSTLAPTGFGSLTMGNATWMGGSTFVLNYNTAVTSPIPGVDNSVVKAVNGAILDLSNLSSSNRMNLQLNAIPGGSGSDSSVVYTFAQYPQILGLTPGNVSQLFNITGNYSGTPLVSYIHASSDILQVSFTPAPEPTSLLLGAALGLGLWRFRLKKGIKLN